MFKRRVNKKGQAVAELAILGTLIIAAFAYIMSFGQSLSAEQQIKMEAFRRAMQKAYLRNGSVDFTLKKYSRSASVNAGFLQGQGTTPQASGKVMWQKGQAGDFKSDDQSSFNFWQVNDTLTVGQDQYGLPRYIKTIVNNDGSEKDVFVPVSVYKEDATRIENYSFDSTKQESNSGIGYQKNANLVDSASSTTYAHYDTKTDEDPWDDDTPTPEYSDAVTDSYSVSDTYDYEKGWIVDN